MSKILISMLFGLAGCSAFPWMQLEENIAEDAVHELNDATTEYKNTHKGIKPHAGHPHH